MERARSPLAERPMQVVRNGNLAMPDGRVSPEIHRMDGQMF
jgi:hypothetical protein